MALARGASNRTGCFNYAMGSALHQSGHSSTRLYQLLAAIWLGNLRPVVLGTSALGQERSFDPNFPNVRFTSKADITGSISDWNERRNTYTCT